MIPLRAVSAPDNHHIRNDDTRYAQKGTALGEDGSSLIMVAGAGFGRYLPFGPEVTLVLPSLRGVRENEVVPTALAEMCYLSSIVRARPETTSITP